MSYKPVLLKYCEKRNKNFLEGKDTILLAQKGEEFFEVKEYIGLITKIYPKYYWSGEISEVKIRFLNCKEYKVRVYLDKNIHLNDFVSIFGIFTKNENGDLELTCKGGMVQVFETLGQAGRVNSKYLYRFGIVQLSEAKESKKFPKMLEEIEVLENNMLWTLSSDNLELLEKNCEQLLEEEKNIVDFSTETTIFVKDDFNLATFDKTVQEAELIRNKNMLLPFINWATYELPDE